MSSGRGDRRALIPDEAEVEAWACEYAATGDRAVRNQLLEAMIPLAEMYARRFQRPGASVEDLRQVGLLSMLRAIDRFDPERQVQFKTFASRTVEGEVKRYLRDRTWTVRPPRARMETYLAVRSAQEDLTQRLGRIPTADEIARALDVTVDDVLHALEAAGGRGFTPIDPLASGASDDAPARERAVDVEDGYARIELETVIGELIDRLGEREQTVLRMRFFEQCSQEEIADALGLSQSYLSRLLRKALAELRSRFVDPEALHA